MTECKGCNSVTMCQTIGRCMLPDKIRWIFGVGPHEMFPPHPIAPPSPSSRPSPGDRDAG